MNEFKDIRKGDLVRITNADRDTLTIVQGVAAYTTEGLSNNYWLTEQGVMLCTRLERGTIEILGHPEPTYHICIEEITGAAHVPGSLTAKEVAEYIADSVNWRVALEIKITKEGN